MLVIGKTKAFSLVEIIVSLAIFSIIITTVMTVSISMLNVQKNIQSKLFLAQTAQTTLESMSRQVRYGYNYSGNTEATFQNNLQSIIINATDVSTQSGSSATSSQNLTNAKNSPFILFEAQIGNPNTLVDQNAYCAYNGKLYKITNFTISSGGTNFSARCDSGSSMLPDNITLENISFDIYSGSSEYPKNPTVRIKIRLKHEDTGSLDVQSSVTQRLVSYF